MSVKFANLFSWEDTVTIALQPDFKDFMVNSIPSLKTMVNSWLDTRKYFRQITEEAGNEADRFERDGTGSLEAASQKFDLSNRLKDREITQEVVTLAHMDICNTVIAVDLLCWNATYPELVKYSLEDKKGKIYKSFDELNEHLPMSEYTFKFEAKILPNIEKLSGEYPLKILDKTHLKRNTETLRTFAEEAGLEDFDKELLLMFSNKADEIFGIKDLKLGRIK